MNRSLRSLSTWLALTALAAAGCSTAPEPSSPSESAPAAASPDDSALTLPELDAQVTALLAAFDANGTAAARDALLAALRRRAPVITQLVENDPAAALAGALAPDLLGRLRAALPEADVLLERPARVSGSLDVFLPEDPRGVDLAPDFRLRLDDGRAVQLHLAAAPAELTSNLGIAADGLFAPRGAAADVTHFAALEARVDATASRLPPGSSCTHSGPQKFAVILVKPPGAADPMSADEIRSLYADPDPNVHSLNGYWNETSYGTTSAAADVFGWYTLDKEYACTDLVNLFNKAAALADDDVNFLDYRGFTIVLPMPAKGCSYAGTSSQGCGGSFSSPGDGSFVASMTFLISDYLNVYHDGGVGLLAHEHGHSLTVSHASGRDYGGETWGAPGTPGTISEYGDPFSVMGNATNLKLGHYNVQSKRALGWLDPAQVTSIESNGSYLLSAAETLGGGGARSLRIRRAPGSSEWLWMEWRQPIATYDLLPQSIFDGVLLHVEDPATLYNRTHLLDATPNSVAGLADFNDAALPIGSTYTDIYTGLQVSPTLAGGDLAVDVAYNAPSCTLQPAQINTSPVVGQVTGGQVISYVTTLTSRDVNCPAQSYKLTPSLPPGWTVTPASVNVTAASGQTASATFTVTVPANVAGGLWGVKVTQSRVSGTSYGLATAAAGSPSPGFTATLTAPAGPIPVGVQQALKVTLKKNNGAVQVGTVQLSIINPDGTSGYAQVGTNNSGVSTILITPAKPGVYSIIADGVAGGLYAVSNTASVTAL